MILEALLPIGALPSSLPSQQAVENASSSRIFSLAVPGTGSSELNYLTGSGTPESVPTQSIENPIVEEFDWSNKKVRQAFIRLEQKVLAGKCTIDEEHRYRSMKSQRNAEIFADRTFMDYAEVQRLRKLAERLEEIQQYIRPIQFQ